MGMGKKEKKDTYLIFEYPAYVEFLKQRQARPSGQEQFCERTSVHCLWRGRYDRQTRQRDRRLCQSGHERCRAETVVERGIDM